MQTFLLTLALTLAVVVAFGLLINYARRRLRNTPHGLTGMCHKDGGRLCATCVEGMRPPPPGHNQWHGSMPAGSRQRWHTNKQ
ncbi:hypothetical protein [Desulfurivibrio dismutans]|uniref:hypothetical protein n=1 Tax=Desulfurivibrio dismutans TaxID=1398908 RepID=UPI0023DA93AA|nr:hypothetical protein [Desulfurivibrio alkaliphilus]MDF1614170.1 hypothetical protein [Desulfurivibrio alkaliphilus]